MIILRAIPSWCFSVLLGLRIRVEIRNPSLMLVYTMEACVSVVLDTRFDSIVSPSKSPVFLWGVCVEKRVFHMGYAGEGLRPTMNYFQYRNFLRRARGNKLPSRSGSAKYQNQRPFDRTLSSKWRDGKEKHGLLYVSRSDGVGERKERCRSSR
jgi:hypothetical protein